MKYVNATLILFGLMSSIFLVTTVEARTQPMFSFSDWDSLNLQSKEHDSTQYEVIMGNIREVLYREVNSFDALTSKAKDYLDSMSSSGAWNDLTYTGDRIPTTHLDRLITMALVYTNNQSTSCGDSGMYMAIVRGIQWWYDQNPDHQNWFYDQIAYPQRIGQVLILMRNGVQRVPAALESNVLYRMESKAGAPDQEGSQGTGANKMNIAMHWVYRGCLTGDMMVLEKGVEQAFYPLFLTTKEGLQHDYAYLQHGQQLYIGGYGWDIVNGMTAVALYISGTSYTLKDEKLDHLSNFVRQAYLRVIRGQNFMFNAFGRGIARPNGANQSGFVSILKRMKIVDAAYADTYDAAIARLDNNKPPCYGVESAHTHFYSSDYTLHTNPAYTFEVRAVSRRTLRNENGNGENVKGYFLSDGATAIAVTGKEYEHIFPSWDWSMIPGTTTRKGTMPQPRQWGTPGSTTFVGGVSDTTCGVSVYDLDDNSTQAKKAYFFFEDEIVCLGAGIHNAEGAEEVVTTLNQCLLQSDITTCTKAGVVYTYSGSNTNLNYKNDLEWVLQGNVGYVLPNGGNVGLAAQQQRGKWKDINRSGPDDDITNNVFTLWMKHGINPNHGDYAYIVVPDIRTVSQMKSYTAKDNIRILKNDSVVQAVKHRELGLYGFVFHEAMSRFTNDKMSIEVSSPCLMMIRPTRCGKLKLHVADPTKSLKQITIQVVWPGFIDRGKFTFDLPTEAASAGKSVVTYLVQP